MNDSNLGDSESNIPATPSQNNQDIIDDFCMFGGQVGIVFDGRGRPLEIDASSSKRISNLKKWSEAMNEYPEIGK